ncbi:MAG: LacI family DNA-binding transcriptional regulator [Betaproteobacteria bacterium]|nr:LacI family DNA-binding transcriptional regulator [Betaproteobacteria bacterium]
MPRAAGGKSATIKDVARKAGVSIATVSRALTNPGRVKAETVARIRATAEALKYVPDRAARSLVSKQFGTIGAIVPTIDNAMFAKALHALQSRLNTHGYTLLLASTDYQAERESAELQSLVERGIDGIVLVGAEHGSEVARLIEARAIPFVHTWIYDGAGQAPCIGFDNRLAMMRLANYLYDLGHRRFAMIAGITRGNDRAAQRKAGLVDALAARGIKLPAARIVERPYSIADGRSALRMLLAQREPPTAVVCGNDILAHGALYECIAQGVSVPQSLSIAGFDDVELSSHIVPSLTTMRVPAAEIGLCAADFLVARLAGTPTPDHVRLEAELVVRSSTAPPPAA